jgi:type II secretory pathway pseudopilin PulG
MITVYIIAGLLLLCSILVLTSIAQSKRAKKAEAKAKALHEAFWQVKEKAERLQKALSKQIATEANANAERDELAKTPDSGLVGRANALFGGVRYSGEKNQ